MMLWPEIGQRLRKIVEEKCFFEKLALVNIKQTKIYINVKWGKHIWQSPVLQVVKGERCSSETECQKKCPRNHIKSL